MTLAWILGAFLIFMAFIWGVHALDDYASARYAYAPFAMPNVLFMLVPHALLIFTIRDSGALSLLLASLISVATLGIFVLVTSRTNLWIALVCTPLMLLCAPLLVFTILFRGLARGNASDGS